MGQIVGAIEGLKDACTALSYPIVSGNVSLYNDTEGASILPTPAIGGVGLLSDVDKRLQQRFTNVGDAILLVGNTKGALGQSLYLREILKREEGAPPPVNLEAERAHAEMILSLNEKGLLSACHDVSDGGMLVALAEMCMASQLQTIGAQIKLPDVDIPAHAYVFGEDQARYLIAVPPHFKDTVMVLLNQAEIAFDDLGETIPEHLIVEGQMSEKISVLSDIHRRWLRHYMGA
jgi:phosphoribosylformylglycinamidine synthase